MKVELGSGRQLRIGVKRQANDLEGNRVDVRQGMFSPQPKKIENFNLLAGDEH